MPDPFWTSMVSRWRPSTQSFWWIIWGKNQNIFVHGLRNCMQSWNWYPFYEYIYRYYGTKNWRHRFFFIVHLYKMTTRTIPWTLWYWCTLWIFRKSYCLNQRRTYWWVCKVVYRSSDLVPVITIFYWIGSDVLYL